MGRRCIARGAALLTLAGAALGASGCFSLGEGFERAIEFVFIELPHLASPWSPEGDRLLIGGGFDELSCVDLSSGETTRLAEHGVMMPSFAPDGSALLCAGRFGKTSKGLWIESADGRDRRLLSEAAGGDDWLFSLASAAWSPDGRWIAVAGLESLELVRPDLSERRVLFTGIAFFPAWSPDGRRLAFNAGRSPHSDAGFQVVSVEDGERQFIADGAFPSWSPDGHRLAFVTDSGDTSAQEIHVVDASGVNERALCPGSFPRWSPCSDELLVHRREAEESLVFVVAVDGSGERLLARGNTAWWSPDGSQVSLYRKNELFLVQADGSGERSLGRPPRTPRPKN
jgi:Tol biopolymer transport system component